MKIVLKGTFLQIGLLKWGSEGDLQGFPLKN